MKASRLIVLVLAVSAAVAVACAADEPATVPEEQAAVSQVAEETATVAPAPVETAPAETAPAETPAAAETAPVEAPAAAVAEPVLNKAGPEVTGLQEWFNGDPTTIGQQIADGRVVLVDFWTYTCINCIRTFPFLRQWHDKYADRGLTILGIHSPEFEFEKVADNVADAIDRYDLGWRVAQDNEFETWRAFNNRFWPAKYLFDTSGEIIYSHFGEGDYLETEEKIREVLTAAGYDVSDIPVGGIEAPERDPDATAMTRELYGGYERNYSFNGQYAGQAEYYDDPDVELFYEDDLSYSHNRWYLQGLWRNEREAIVHARDTENLEDYFAIKFAARSVIVVMNPVAPEPFEVVVEIDGEPLTEAQAGEDVTWNAEGRSLLKVDGGREYLAVELDEFGVHELKLRSNSSNFAIFALTFGINLAGA